MGIFSRFEGRVEDTFEGAANKMFDSPISPVQIAKKAEKQMRREKMVGAGKQYAPTLYTILVNADDDHRLFGYYPTLAGETETYLSAKAMDEGLVMDGQPLVRFIADDSLKRGKFEVIAEMVASPIVEQLRDEEMDRYGIGNGNSNRGAAPVRQGQPQRSNRPQSAPANAPRQNIPPQGVPRGQADPYADPYANPFDDQASFDGKPPLPYVPEDEIDYSIDYGEYTFDSQDFEDYRQNGPAVSSSQGFSQPNNPSSDFGYEEPGMPEALRHRPSKPLQNPATAAGNFAANVAGQMQAPTAPPAGAPNTVVFAAGSGNAQPMPQGSMVRASLMNVNDNRSYDLATARLLLGRDNNNDIVVDDINASRTHAEVRHESQGVWVITDLGSTNGTLVNGREVNSQALRDGDYITIGMTNYVFIQA